MIRLVDAGRVKIVAYLAEDVVISGLLDVGDHHFLGVSLGIGAGFAKLFGGPKPERPVAARRRLEAKLLVEDEFALEAFFAVFHAVHDVPPRSEEHTSELH